MSDERNDLRVEEQKSQPDELTPEQEAIGEGRAGEVAPIQNRLTLARQLGHAWENLSDFVTTKISAAHAAGFEDAMIKSFLGYRHPAPMMSGLKAGLSHLLGGANAGPDDKPK